MWNDAEHDQVIKTLAVVCEVTGTQVSQPARLLIVRQLGLYPAKYVLAALERCALECKFKLTLADIVQRVDDGHPGAESAWASFPKSEYDAAVVTQEMATAWGAAAPLYTDGDHVAARMAFKEVYDREVRRARESGIEPYWFVSAGWNSSATEDAAIDGMRRGLVAPEMALHFIAPHRRDQALQLAGRAPLALPEASDAR